MKPKKSKPVKIQRLIGRLLNRIESSYPDPGHRIWEVWQEAVGLDIAKRSQPLEFRDGRLTVAVSSAPWVQQLTFLAPKIIKTVNEKVGRPLVVSLRCKLATVEPPVEIIPEPEPWREDPLTDEDEKTARQCAEEISDPKLKEAIEKARAMALKRQRRLQNPED